MSMQRRIIDAIDSGETLAVVTLIDGPGTRGGRMTVDDTGKVEGSFDDKDVDAVAGTAAREVITRGIGGGKTVTDALGRTIRLFVELYESPPWLIVVGAGHVAKPTAALGKMVGMRVTVLDDRPEFANWERFPEADEVIAEDFEPTLRRLFPKIHRQTYIVLVTRGHKQDEMALREVALSKAGYVGMIGSRRRSKMVLQALLDDGYPRVKVEAIHAPIGVDIRAETPEEIAVSIIGEIIAVRRGGTARTLSGRSVLPRPKVEVSGGP